MTQHCTRLAPSPTGALHLGNARTFVLNWMLARQQGWRIVLRIEDLDGPRVKRRAAEDLLETLRWLGLDWDEGPFYQTHDRRPYQQALVSLGKKGAIYPCSCTRSDILAASLSAPHNEHELCYPGTCRPRQHVAYIVDDPEYAGCGWRIKASAGSFFFDDEFAGSQVGDLSTIGDFLVATKDGAPSYQLAVVVDDARQGVDRVVRGDDLLTSVPRQQLIYQTLGLGSPPLYWHLPLVVGTDGRRLAKRHGDTRVDSYRAAGVSVQRLLGLLARWSGLLSVEEITLTEYLDHFDLDGLPHHRIVFSPSDHEWLLKSS